MDVSLGMYGPPYGASATASQSYGNGDPSAFCASLNSHYDIKHSAGNLHSRISQPAVYHPYDSMLGPYQYDRYGAVDFNGSARRKNASRETTSTLKAWLNEHHKNPYPTKSEKIMLAIITKMTLTQVSTWFANARRRLKKENKMTWSVKNKSGDSENGDPRKTDHKSAAEASKDSKGQDHQLRSLEDVDDGEHCKLDRSFQKASEEEWGLQHTASRGPPERDCSVVLGLPGHISTFAPVADLMGSMEVKPVTQVGSTSTEPLPFGVSEKPRIWSPAHTAATGVLRSPHQELQTAKEAISYQQPQSVMVPVSREGWSAGPKGHQEMPKPQSHEKDLGTFSQTLLQLHGISYPVLPDHYLPSKGLSCGGTTEGVLAGLRGTCVMPQKESACDKEVRKMSCSPQTSCRAITHLLFTYTILHETHAYSQMFMSSSAVPPEGYSTCGALHVSSYQPHEKGCIIRK